MSAKIEFIADDANGFEASVEGNPIHAVEAIIGSMEEHPMIAKIIKAAYEGFLVDNPEE